MKLSYIKSHWSAGQAYDMLILLDNLRDTIWQNYRDEIIEYCHQQQCEELDSSAEIDDDIIPF
jgi:hypothetical protein